MVINDHCHGSVHCNVCLVPFCMNENECLLLDAKAFIDRSKHKVLMSLMQRWEEKTTQNITKREKLLQKIT